MWRTLRDVTGLTKRTQYESDSFVHRNIIASIYMAVIVLILESWMVYSLTNHILHSDKVRTTQWLVEHYGPYAILIVSSLVMLGYAYYYFKKNQQVTGRVSRVLILLYSLICIAFGIRVGVASFAGGDQIFGFLTMVIFVCCLYVWHPVNALIFSGVVFIYFYHLCAQTEFGVNQDFRINFFTLWVVIFMFQIMNFHQTLSQARKDEILERHAKQDTLTGLTNNRHFMNEAAKLLNEPDAAGKYAILYLNVENFKAYNEKHGFEKGSQCLIDIGRKVSEIFAEDMFARDGDDHFIVITKASASKEKAEQIHLAVMELGDGVRMDMKIGSYLVKTVGESVPQALDYARRAAETTVKRAEIFYQEYDEKMGKESEIRQFVLDHVDQAVAEGHIQVFYQPIVWCKDGKVCGYEALARWIDPERGMLAPYQFITTLEEFHLIDRVDKAVVEQVCQRLRSQLDKGETVVPISVNFSRLDFELYDVVGYLHEMCTKYNVPEEYVDVEVTESALSSDTKTLYSLIGKARTLGHSLWLDDFGSGYSSLNVLKEYKFDVMKIDMVFMRGIENNPEAQKIVHAMINLGKEIGMQPLTEGVETAEQFAFLQQAGCVRAQGYYFSKPLPWEEMEKLFRDGKLAY